MRRDDAIDLLNAHAAELRARGVLRLSIFGSTARDMARAGSDVDVLVEIDPARRFSLIDLSELRLYLSDLLGCDVDIAERGYLKPLLRDAILADAVDVVR